MNISTGGPHILLFERDQQLTALITSEFQLAGYECHSARTAVEVFDALARYPIRIVLVDLAQAAAARREFWVALDTQRRGRGVHVLTFHCSNLAGYGPQDQDDRSRNTMADLEIDGMLGLMKLVDEVRTRVPGSGAVTNTLPRMPRVGTPQQPAQPIQQSAPPHAFAPTTQQRTGQFPPGAANPLVAANGMTYRTGAASEGSANPFHAGNANAPRNGSGVYAQATASTPAVPTAPNGASGVPAAPEPPASSKTASYTDKIRAVLYPNQRNWSTQGNTPAPAQQDTRPAYDASPAVPANEFTALQRLANGQSETENSAESGLAQLSRLAHASYTTAAPDTYETDDTSASYPLPNSTQPTGSPFPHSHSSMEQVSSNTGPMNYVAAAPPAPQVHPAPQVAPAPPVAQPVQGNERISTQPLRASPIQDLPVERAGGTHPGPENSRRPDVLSRTNYGQQQTAPVAIPPLASISTPPSSQATGAQPATTASSTSSALPVATASQKPADAPQVQQEEREEYFEEDPQETTTLHTAEPSYANGRADEPRRPDDMDQQQKKSVQEQDIPQREGMSTTHNNTMLFDIMQSLPPMPPVTPQPPQSVQPQVLSGRATRSLGSVLLAGHLVPQNRLEVAQNVQRMLRGVDLNYQLGEILLMFKLLTPDQLLAASLVSYGLITTTQISALGRIRQELHSIGLEYDLESLIILFRILTPEQLREVKNSWQG